jgi:hypothetical protein
VAVFLGFSDGDLELAGGAVSVEDEGCFEYEFLEDGGAGVAAGGERQFHEGGAGHDECAEDDVVLDPWLGLAGDPP